MNNDRTKGCLIGLAIGDAIGTTVEFKERGTFEPLTDMVGGGPFRLKPGQWTDDTSMALCLAESLIEKGFDLNDQMDRYYRYWQEGYLTSTGGHCLDIGTTTRNALSRWKGSNDPMASGDTDTMFGSGNGGIMRIAPIAIRYRNDETLLEKAMLSSICTHATKECLDAAKLMCYILAELLNGKTKNDLEGYKFDFVEGKIKEISTWQFLEKEIQYIKGSGYVVESLEAALYCFFKTDNFRDAVLMAANLGDDADTTAAITGQFAGAYYGLSGIPLDWISKTTMNTDILKMAEKLSLHES